MPIPNNKAFTLIEVLIATVILSIGIFALIAMQTTGIRGNATAHQISSASTLGADEAERLLSLPFTTENIHSDLIDDTAPFGLKGLSEIGDNADGSRASADGRWSIYWNIADGIPLPEMKRIRVILVDNRAPEKVRAMTDYLRPINR